MPLGLPAGYPAVLELPGRTLVNSSRDATHQLWPQLMGRTFDNATLRANRLVQYPNVPTPWDVRFDAAGFALDEMRYAQLVYDIPLFSVSIEDTEDWYAFDSVFAQTAPLVNRAPITLLRRLFYHTGIWQTLCDVEASPMLGNRLKFAYDELSPRDPFIAHMDFNINAAIDRVRGAYTPEITWRSIKVARAHVKAHPLSRDAPYTTPLQADQFLEFVLCPFVCSLRFVEGCGINNLSAAGGWSWRRCTAEFTITLPGDWGTMIPELDGSFAAGIPNNNNNNNDSYIIAATILWRLYHLHRILVFGKRIGDIYLVHTTQCLIDTHLPLWCCILQYRIAKDVDLQKPIPGTPLEVWDLYKVFHPLAPNKISERTRELHQTGNAPPVPTWLLETPAYAMFWPHGTLVCTQEEGPSMVQTIIKNSFLCDSQNRTEDVQNECVEQFFVDKKRQKKCSLRGDTPIRKRHWTTHPALASLEPIIVQCMLYGNIPYSNAYRPSFATRIRLWSLFHLQLGPDTAPWLDYLANNRFQVANASSEYIYSTLAVLPHVELSIREAQPNFSMHIASVFEAGNLIRRRLDDMPWQSPGVPHSGYVRRIILFTEETEAIVAKQRTTAVTLANGKTSKMNVYAKIATQFRLFFEQISALITRIVDPTADKKKHAPADEDEDEEPDIDRAADGDINPLYPSNRRTADTEDYMTKRTIQELIFSFLPADFDERGFRMYCEALAKSPDALHNGFLPTAALVLFGVDPEAITILRRIVWACVQSRISDNWLTDPIEQLWTHYRESATIIYKFISLVLQQWQSRMQPLTLHATENQLKARWAAFGYQSISALDEPHNHSFYLCQNCQCWTHPIASRGDVIFVGDIKTGVFKDPVKCAAELETTSSTKARRKLKIQDVIETNVIDELRDDEDEEEENGNNDGMIASHRMRSTLGNLSIFGTTPLATISQGPRDNVSINRVNRRGFSSTNGASRSSSKNQNGVFNSLFADLQCDFGTPGNHGHPLLVCGRPASRRVVLVLTAILLSVRSISNANPREVVHKTILREVINLITNVMPKKKKKKKRTAAELKIIEEANAVMQTLPSDTTELITYVKTKVAALMRDARLPTNMIRARQCGEPLRGESMLGCVRTLHNNLYSVCSACSNIVCASAENYCPELGYLCPNHGMANRGFDPQSGTLLPSPHANRLEGASLGEISAPGHIRLCSTYFVTRPGHLRQPQYAIVHHGGRSGLELALGRRYLPSPGEEHAGAKIVTSRYARGFDFGRIVMGSSVVINSTAPQHYLCDLCPSAIFLETVLVFPGVTKNRLCINHFREFIACQ